MSFKISLTKTGYKESGYEKYKLGDMIMKGYKSSTIYIVSDITTEKLDKNFLSDIKKQSETRYGVLGADEGPKFIKYLNENEEFSRIHLKCIYRNYKPVKSKVKYSFLEIQNKVMYAYSGNKYNKIDFDHEIKTVKRNKASLTNLISKTQLKVVHCEMQEDFFNALNNSKNTEVEVKDNQLKVS